MPKYTYQVVILFFTIFVPLIVPMAVAQPKTVDAIAVWSHKNADYDIYYSIWDDTAMTWSTPDSIDPLWFAANGGNDTFPDIAFDGKGSAIVVWSHSIWPQARIYYSKWDGATQTWSSPTPIPGQTMDYNVNPAIALNNVEEGICIWQRKTDLLYSLWNGITWSSPALIHSGIVGVGWEAEFGTKQPDIAFDSYDYAMAVWTDGPEGKVYYSRWNRSSWSSSLVISGCLPRISGDESRKGISPDLLGNMMLVYEQNLTIYRQPSTVYHSLWNGTTWTLTVPLVPSNITGNFNPAIAYDKANYPVAVWPKHDGGMKCDIWFSTFWMPPTTGQGGLFATSTTGVSGMVDTNYEWWPAIAFLNSGKAMIVYSVSMNYVEGEIYYSLWDPSTMSWSMSTKIVSAGLAGDDGVYNAPAIASNIGSPKIPIPESPSFMLLLLMFVSLSSAIVFMRRRFAQ